MEVPGKYFCPISLTMMLAPNLTEAGNTYGKKDILEHLKTKDFDPLSG